MNTKSSLAKQRYVPGSSRGGLSLVTFQRQMADVARGEQIKALRDQKSRESVAAGKGKITQPVVAAAVGVSLRAEQEWERSTEENPKGIDREHAVALAKFLGVDADDVSRRREEEERSPVQDLNEKLDLLLEYFGIEADEAGHTTTRFADAFAARRVSPAKPSRTAVAKKK